MRLRIAAVLPLLIAAGCGPGTATVSGTVTVAGKPLPSGTVMVQDSTGEVRLAPVTDGAFTLSGVRLGTAKLAVVPGVTGADGKEPSRTHGQFGRGRAKHEKPVAFVAEKWQHLETTPQTVQVDQAAVSVEVIVSAG